MTNEEKTELEMWRDGNILHETHRYELEKAERERDEAREERDHWKTEYEIVVARLCGKKHPRDNEIISEHEIIPKLTQERNEAIDALRMIHAADWKTAGELRGMARVALEKQK